MKENNSLHDSNEPDSIMNLHVSFSGKFKLGQTRKIKKKETDFLMSSLFL